LCAIMAVAEDLIAGPKAHEQIRRSTRVYTSGSVLVTGLIHMALVMVVFKVAAFGIKTWRERRDGLQREAGDETEETLLSSA
jgi:hypothetical protein